LAGDVFSLSIDARKRLADPLLLFGDLVQYRHSDLRDSVKVDQDRSIFLASIITTHTVQQQNARIDWINNLPLLPDYTNQGI